MGHLSGHQDYLVLYSEEGAIIPRSIWPHFLKHGATYGYSYKRIVTIHVEPVVNPWNERCQTRSQYPENLSVFQLRRELFEEMRLMIGVAVPETSQYFGLRVKSGPILNDKFLVRDYLMGGSLLLDLSFYDTRINEALGDFNDSCFEDLPSEDYQNNPSKTPNTAGSSAQDVNEEVHDLYLVHTPKEELRCGLQSTAGEAFCNSSTASIDADSGNEVKELWEKPSDQFLTNHQNWDESSQKSAEFIDSGRAKSLDWTFKESPIYHTPAKLGGELPLRPAPLDLVSSYHTDQVREWYQDPSRKEELENRAMALQAEIAKLDKTPRAADRTSITQQFAQYSTPTMANNWGHPTSSTAVSWHQPIQPPNTAVSWNQRPPTPKTAVPWYKSQDHSSRRPSHPGYWQAGNKSSQDKTNETSTFIGKNSLTPMTWGGPDWSKAPVLDVESEPSPQSVQMWEAGGESLEWPLYRAPRPLSAQTIEMRNNFMQGRSNEAGEEMDLTDENAMNKF